MILDRRDRLKEADYQVGKFSYTSDDELDSVITHIQRENPNCGLPLISGFLQGQGIHVQRYRLRESVAREDSIRGIVCWQQVVSTRSYNVR